MLTLESTQMRLRDALLSKEHAPLDDILGPTAPRFEIHRRHFIRSVTAALEKTFPAVVNLVDARFFAYAADAFIRAHPPTSPCLFEYGGALSDFLEEFPACASLPYLGDLARMEWAMHSVFHALGSDGECPPTSLRLFSSRWPIDAIWQVAMGRDEGPVDMNSGKAWVLIYREEAEVKFESLSHAGFVFHESYWTQRSIPAAVNLAGKIDPAFDEMKAIAQLERAAAHLDIF
jgi:hypothetical protein